MEFIRQFTESNAGLNALLQGKTGAFTKAAQEWKKQHPDETITVDDPDMLSPVVHNIL